MTKLIDLTAAMTAYNNAVAYGSECNAWQDYVADHHAHYGMTPGNDRVIEDDMDAGDDFADFWLAVAEGRSDRYDAETGAGIGEC